MRQATPVTSRAALFRNRANQAVRIPKAMSFPDDVTEVQLTRVGDVLTVKPARPSWESFFEEWVPQLDESDSAFFDDLAERRPVIEFDRVVLPDVDGSSDR
ncbi:MAG: type II toxin-antitoxin system VapB family antitoxin [Propionibacteriaceae bacterium]|jgi:antitoxin VapB|nr:type II toxin-antitoxin system VapB family antitoxin [Propionibacteriaceae bacterium]